MKINTTFSIEYEQYKEFLSIIDSKNLKKSHVLVKLISRYISEVRQND